MAGIQDVSLRIPETWDAAWFRRFVAEILSRADVRNAVGVGVSVTSDGNSVATISSDSAAAVQGHNLDPLSHAEAFTAHRSESDPHSQYPLKQSTTVADVTGGATVDTECRAQLNALLAALRTAGIIGV
jgi:hypothetical protein